MCAENLETPPILHNMAFDSFMLIFFCFFVKKSPFSRILRLICRVFTAHFVREKPIASEKSLFTDQGIMAIGINLSDQPCKGRLLHRYTRDSMPPAGNFAMCAVIIICWICIQTDNNQCSATQCCCVVAANGRLDAAVSTPN